MTAPGFVSRIQLVSAVQVHHEDEPLIHKSKDSLALFLCPANGSPHLHALDGSIARPGDWLVSSSDGVSFAMSDSAFSAIFYPAGSARPVTVPPQPRPTTLPSGTPAATKEP